MGGRPSSPRPAGYPAERALGSHAGLGLRWLLAAGRWRLGLSFYVGGPLGGETNHRGPHPHEEPSPGEEARRVSHAAAARGSAPLGERQGRTRRDERRCSISVYS